MADDTYQPKVYREQGGDRQVVASGGSMDVESGGELDIESGGALKLAGTEVTAGAAELNRAADVSTRIVTLTGDTAITEALHEGKIILLGEVGGDAQLTATLPAATGSGAVYKFIVSVVNTSNYIIKVVGNDTMDGNILTNSTTDNPDLSQFWATADDSDTITLNATTKGGLSIGDFIELIDMAADQWAVWGITTTSRASEVTPFSAGVS